MIQKKHKYSLALALILFIQIFKAQVTITIPTNNLHSAITLNAQWRKPLGTYFGYERCAAIYTHSEIGQYGSITSLGFYCDTINLPGNTPVTIYMKEVTGTSFSALSTVAAEENGAQMVYSGTLASASFVKGQWVTIALSNPFVHATANSIEVIVETNATGTGNEVSLGKGFYHYVTSLSSTQYWSADNVPPSNNGTLSTLRPNIQFNVTPITSCSGQPNAGTTVSSVDTTCSLVSLSLTGNTAALGLTYQWQDSLAGGAWTSITNANSSVLTTSISANTWFRCLVSCGSLSSYSVVKQVVIRNYLQCYCTANLGGGCSTGAIDSVAISTTTLANGLTGCSVNNYIQYPAVAATSAQLASGQSYNLHTKFVGNVIASVWLDYNQNGMFDSIEWKQIILTTKTDSDYVTVLNVPANAKTGLTLMRIRSRASGNLNGYNDACSNFASGETEDYFIGINYDVNTPLINNPKASILLYPNPANSEIFVAGNFVVGEPVNVKIYTLEGVLQNENTEVFTGKSLRADISSVPAGAYFVQVSGNGFNLVKKLLINR